MSYGRNVLCTLEPDRQFLDVALDVCDVLVGLKFGSHETELCIERKHSWQEILPVSTIKPKPPNVV